MGGMDPKARCQNADGQRGGDGAYVRLCKQPESPGGRDGEGGWGCPQFSFLNLMLFALYNQ